MTEQLKKLFEQTFNQNVAQIHPLPRSASYRQYYRIIGEDGFSVIGTYNPDAHENEAFIYMSEYFLKKKLPVPVIYAKDMEKNIYLQQDLGSQTLLNHILELKQRKQNFIPLLKQVLDNLIKFQTAPDSDFDWDKCYPVKEYDGIAYAFDLNYFKYMVLKVLKANINEAALQKEFDTITDFLLQTNHRFFVYRDFQTRNIMHHYDALYFIDYQGGRRGSLFYDLVSLLYDTKLMLSPQQRQELKNYYYTRTHKLHGLSPEVFNRFFMVFALVRKLQALAAYSIRGLVENKLIFILGLDRAFADVFEILEQDQFPLDLTELKKALKQAYDNIPYKRTKLDVKLEINSFSYILQGYPPDEGGNGGGFVFDCRALPNPGRVEELSSLTGLDKPVQQWLDANAEFEDFIVRVFSLVYDALVKYHNKGYTRLQVNFGCTGGRHRSVYCAEKLAEILRSFLDMEIEVRHLMADKWPEI